MPSRRSFYDANDADSSQEYGGFFTVKEENWHWDYHFNKEKYHQENDSGMCYVKRRRKEKEERKAYFEKHGKMPDNNPGEMPDSKTSSSGDISTKNPNACQSLFESQGIKMKSWAALQGGTDENSTPTEPVEGGIVLDPTISADSKTSSKKSKKSSGNNSKSSQNPNKTQELFESQGITFKSWGALQSEKPTEELAPVAAKTPDSPSEKLPVKKYQIINKITDPKVPKTRVKLKFLFPDDILGMICGSKMKRIEAVRNSYPTIEKVTLTASDTKDQVMVWHFAKPRAKDSVKRQLDLKQARFDLVGASQELLLNSEGFIRTFCISQGLLRNFDNRSTNKDFLKNMSKKTQQVLEKDNINALQEEEGWEIVDKQVSKEIEHVNKYDKKDLINVRILVPDKLMKYFVTTKKEKSSSSSSKSKEKISVNNKLTDLEIQYCVHIQTFKECAPRSTERIFSITGVLPDIMSTIEEILEIIIKKSSKIKDEKEKPYTGDFDRKFKHGSKDYGGYVTSYDARSNKRQMKEQQKIAKMIEQENELDIERQRIEEKLERLHKNRPRREKRRRTNYGEEKDESSDSGFGL